MTGRKKESTLRLEMDCPREKQQVDPFPGLTEILDPKAIVKRSQEALGMSGAMTLSDAMPELTIIARREGLNLNNAKDWKEAIRLMDMAKLNRR